MRIFFDTEFIEDGKTIDLISIGLVKETGESLYLESADCARGEASDWVRENVFPHLRGPLVSRSHIADSVRSFAGSNPEFWAYYADYDWVVLCQLYGTMMDLPEGWPMYCRDLKQLADERGADLSALENPKEHHALADAQWVKSAFETMKRRDAPKRKTPPAGKLTGHRDGAETPSPLG